MIIAMSVELLLRQVGVPVGGDQLTLDSVSHVLIIIKVTAMKSQRVVEGGDGEQVRFTSPSCMFPPFCLQCRVAESLTVIVDVDQLPEVRNL